MISPFENLTGFGKPLKAEPPDTKEFAGLCRSGLARLKDAANEGLSLEGRFDLAYNAAHALCLAALRRQGYRSANRYIVFQLLPHTLGLGAEVWRVLAKCHEVRNLGEYEGDLNIDARLVPDLITACRGRCLRRPAGEERAGYEVRRRPAFHAAAADPGHGDLRGTQTR